jgi:hypothetical protein
VIGWQTIAVRLFGTGTDVSVAPNVAWGGEDDLPGELLPAEPLALAAVVFGLAATPEPENQGAFVRAVATRAAPGTRVVAVVDESTFRSRFAQLPDRLEERRRIWRDMLAAHGLAPVFVDLEAPDLAAAEADLEAAIGQPPDIAP